MEVGYKELPLSLIIISMGVIIWGITTDNLALTVFGLLGFILFESKKPCKNSEECSSEDIIKRGILKGNQRYYCKSCKNKFAKQQRSFANVVKGESK